MRLGERCDTIIRLIEQALEDEHGAGPHGSERPPGARHARSAAATSPAHGDPERSG